MLQHPVHYITSGGLLLEDLCLRAMADRCPPRSCPLLCQEFHFLIIDEFGFDRIERRPLRPRAVSFVVAGRSSTPAANARTALVTNIASSPGRLTSATRSWRWPFWIGWWTARRCEGNRQIRPHASRSRYIPATRHVAHPCHAPARVRRATSYHGLLLKNAKMALVSGRG